MNLIKLPHHWNERHQQDTTVRHIQKINNACVIMTSGQKTMFHNLLQLPYRVNNKYMRIKYWNRKSPCHWRPPPSSSVTKYLDPQTWSPGRHGPQDRPTGALSPLRRNHIHYIYIEPDIVLPRYKKTGSTSTVASPQLASSHIWYTVWRNGWIVGFTHDIRNPRPSVTLGSTSRNRVSSPIVSAKMMVSSAKSRSVNISSPNATPKNPRLTVPSRTMSIQTPNSEGTRTHPCLTPVETRKKSDTPPPHRTALSVSVDMHESIAESHLGPRGIVWVPTLFPDAPNRTPSCSQHRLLQTVYSSLLRFKSGGLPHERIRLAGVIWRMPSSVAEHPHLALWDVFHGSLFEQSVVGLKVVPPISSLRCLSRRSQVDVSSRRLESRSHIRRVRPGAVTSWIPRL